MVQCTGTECTVKYINPQCKCDPRYIINNQKRKTEEAREIFRKKINDRLNFKTILEFAFIFAAIPVISPLAWKAYFIFLWLPYLLIYLVLFRFKYAISLRKKNIMKGIFYVSIMLTVFSTEAFTGGDFSDVLETFGAITFGSIISIVLLIIFHLDCDKINSKSLVLKNDLS